MSKAKEHELDQKATARVKGKEAQARASLNDSLKQYVETRPTLGYVVFDHLVEFFGEYGVACFDARAEEYLGFGLGPDEYLTLLRGTLTDELIQELLPDQLVDDLNGGWELIMFRFVQTPVAQKRSMLIFDRRPGFWIEKAGLALREQQERSLFEAAIRAELETRIDHWEAKVWAKQVEQAPEQAQEVPSVSSQEPTALPSTPTVSEAKQQSASLSTADKRRQWVDAVIKEAREKDITLNRTKIWKAAGYKVRSMFERWERDDKKQTERAKYEIAKVLKDRPWLKNQ